MTPRINLALLLGTLVTLGTAACGGSTESSDPGPTGGASTDLPGTSSSASDPGAALASEYRISCRGGVTKLSAGVELQVEPKCIGNGAPGTRCGDDPVCVAQDVTFFYALPAHKCAATDVFSWNGKECVAHKTGSFDGSLHCKGKDCEKLYASKESCDEAHSFCFNK